MAPERVDDNQEELYFKDGFREYWENQAYPGRPTIEHDELDYWIKEYSREVLTLLNSKNTVVDTGSGNGEILANLAPEIEKIYAVDYSKTMLDEAKRKCDQLGITNCTFLYDDMIQIDKIIPEKVDAIFNHSVLQYLTKTQTEQFIINAKRTLKPGGELLMMNIPNVAFQELFSLGFFKSEGSAKFSVLIRRYFKHKLDILKEKIKDPNFVHWAGVGYWYSVDWFEAMAVKHGYTCSRYAPMQLHFGYRFHVKLTLEN